MPVEGGDPIAKYVVRYAKFDRPSPVGGHKFEYTGDQFEEAKAAALRLLNDRETVYVEFRRVEE